MMLNMFNAFKCDKFTDIDALIKLFKQQFHSEEVDKDLKSWKMVIEGPGKCNILDFSYEFRGICKDTTLTLDKIRNQYQNWSSRYIFEKICSCESRMNIFECKKNEDANNSDNRYVKKQNFKNDNNINELNYKNKYNQKFNNDYKNKDKMKFDDEN
ncbi:hypothetical protein DMUE_0309 [Dictyocoela muelleri]|nr:hypothetical protein DMUE_0309 [Dictyocoela muelleri]